MKDVIGYEGLYQLDEYGNIYSTPRKGTKGGRLPFIVDEYYEITLTKKAKSKRYNIHRLVALHYLENPNRLPMVNHKDGDKFNNHYSNLEWCDSSHNIKHAYDNGLMTPKRGSKNGMSKLTEEKVLAIRQYAKAHPTNYRSYLSEKYNVSKSNIKDIVTNRRNSWSHVCIHNSN